MRTWKPPIDTDSWHVVYTGGRAEDVEGAVAIVEEVKGFNSQLIGRTQSGANREKVRQTSIRKHVVLYLETYLLHTDLSFSTPQLRTLTFELDRHWGCFPPFFFRTS